MSGGFVCRARRPTAILNAPKQGTQRWFPRVHRVASGVPGSHNIMDTLHQQHSFDLPATNQRCLGLRHGDPSTGALPVFDQITPMVMCRPHPSRPNYSVRAARPLQLYKANQQHVLASSHPQAGADHILPSWADPQQQLSTRVTRTSCVRNYRSRTSLADRPPCS